MRPLDEIDYPQDAEEWWAMVEHHQENILSLCAAFHPYYRKSHPQMPITAARAEEACKDVREEILKEGKGDPQVRFRANLKSKQAVEMVNLLNEVWFGMPESSNVREQPGFFELCDLCSECYCVIPDEDEEKDNQSENQS